MDYYPPGSVSLKPCPSKGVARLAKGEFMIKCPYDKSHEVLNTSYYKHMEKCRRNYETKYRSQGQAPDKLACKYNSEHQILAPEIFFHEHSCPDKHKRVLENLLTERKKINDILAGNFDSTKLQGIVDHTELELDENLLGAAGGEERGGFVANLSSIMELGVTGIYVNLDKLAWDLVKAGKVEALFPFPSIKGLENGKVAWADPERTESGITAVEPDLGRLSQLDDPPFTRRQRWTRNRMSKEPKNLTSVQEEEDDINSEAYWAKSSGTTFDWYTHQFTWRPEGTAPMKYPPGLSKSGRKEFVKWNTERLRTEFGVLPNYDEPTRVVRRDPRNIPIGEMEEIPTSFQARLEIFDEVRPL